MKTSLKLCFILTLFFFPFVSGAEYIESFRADLTLEEDTSLHVTEEITYVFTEPRHGIFRTIPTTHPQKASHWYKERYVDIDVVRVAMDGAEVPYEVFEEGNELSIKIGDPARMVDGLHNYTLTYTVAGAITYLKYGGAELYWNVSGHEWEVPILTVEAALSAPHTILTRERACYRGLFGSTASCNLTTEREEHIVFQARELAPGEGMTIAHGLDRAQIPYVVLERTNMLWFIVVGGAMWLLMLVYFVYRYRTAHKTHRSIVPHYEPYRDVKPMYTGLLFDGTLHPEDITACIVYLAGQGFLKIKKIEKKVLFFFEVDDYEMTLLKPIEGIQSPFQKAVIKLLFQEHTTSGEKIALSDLKSSTSKQKANYRILQQLKKDLAQDLVMSGFFQKVNATHYFLGIGGLLLTCVLFFVWIPPQTVPVHVFAFALLVFLSLAVLAFMYRRRTRKGYEALDHLEGFRQFLSITEQERYAFHNAPSKSPEQFMEYLPYAIAFGVEREWAEVFKDVTIPNPEWYDGGSVGHFNATNLTTSLGAFSTAFAGSSGPASSGGGSVGGGAGGGGGGSW